MNAPRAQAGFTLIEALVAVVVLGIGLSGMAGLQILSFRSGQQAYQRTQASLLAYDIVDRMRANVPAVLAGDYDTGFGDNVSALELCFGITADCTPAEFADHDRRMWRRALNTSLPGGSGAVATAVVGGQTQATVTVQWVEADQAQGTVPQQLSLTVTL